MKLLSLSIDGKPITPPTGIPAPQTGMVERVVNNAITLFMVVGLITSILVLVWAGIQWVTSGGDKQKIAAARARITWGIIGLVVILTSFLIIKAFDAFFGITLCDWCGRTF